MTTENGVEVEARIRNDAALQAIKKIQDDLKQGFKAASDDAAQSIGNLGKSIATDLVKAFSITAIAERGFENLKAAIAGTIDFVKESIAAAIEAEANERKLVNVLKLRGEYTQENVEKLLAFNAALAKNSTLEDDALTAVEAQLASYGVMRKDLERVTLAAVGLSEKFGIDLKTATDAVGSAVVNSAEKLKRYGIDVTDVSKAVDELGKGQILAAENADSLGGRVTQLGNSWGNLKEAIGGVISQSSLVKDTLKSVRDAIDGITEAVQSASPSLRQFGEATASATVRGALNMIPGVGIIASAYDAYKGTQSLARGGEAVPESAPSPLVTPEGEGTPLATKNRKQEEDAAKERAGERRKKESAERKRLQAELDAERKSEEEADNAYQEYLSKLRAEREEKERKASEAKADAGFRYRAAQYDRERELADFVAKQREENAERTDRINDQEVEAQRRYWGQLGDVAASGAENFITSIAASVGRGEKIDFGGLFGNLLVALGTTAVQMGTVAVLAGTLGTVVPALFGGITGGPAGVAAGAALIGGGILAIAAGSALGKKGGSAPGGARTAGAAGFGASAPSGSRPGGSTGFAPPATATGQPTTTVINVSLASSGAAVVGSAAEVGRWIGRQLQASERLSPSLATAGYRGRG